MFFSALLIELDELYRVFIVITGPNMVSFDIGTRGPTKVSFIDSSDSWLCSTVNAEGVGSDENVICSPGCKFLDISGGPPYTLELFKEIGIPEEFSNCSLIDVDLSSKP